jgi:hypothetical protein
LLAIALVAAACGDSKETSSTTTKANTAATTAGGAATTVAAATCKTDRAMKVVGLAEKPPESANAIPDYANGWELAVTQINDKGGVCGQKIDFERIPMSPTDVATAKVAYLSAIDKKADITFGMNSSTIVLAVAPEVLKAATPNIYLSAASQVFIGAANGVGNEWGFVIRPRNNSSAVMQADYLTKDLGKKKIGLLCAIGAFGDSSCGAAKPAIEAAGATIVSQQSAATDATNLTTQILAFKNAGADAILAFEFPNPMVVLFNQMADNSVQHPGHGRRIGRARDRHEECQSKRTAQRARHRRLRAGGRNDQQGCDRLHPLRTSEVQHRSRLRRGRGVRLCVPGGRGPQEGRQAGTRRRSPTRCARSNIRVRARSTSLMRPGLAPCVVHRVLRCNRQAEDSEDRCDSGAHRRRMIPVHSNKN